MFVECFYGMKANCLPSIRGSITVLGTMSQKLNTAAFQISNKVYIMNIRFGKDLIWCEVSGIHFKFPVSIMCHLIIYAIET